jgi:hypothetical protein
MTSDEILALKLGRELDALVAEKVMGWFLDSDIGYWRNESGLCKRQDKWSPSEDISAAWEVVEEMGDCLHLRQHGEQGEWEAWFCGYPNSKAHGETAPEAICKASLLAVTGEALVNELPGTNQC